MNEGINLASRPIRSRAFVRAVGGAAVLLGILATGIHLFGWLRTRADAARMRDDVTRMEERLESLVRQTEDAYQSLERPSSRATIRWLVALERSQAAEAVYPAEILRVIEEVLPLDARVLSLRLEASPPETAVNIEAVAGAARSAADFVSGLSDSGLVRELEILEERHKADGDIFLRIEVAVGSRSTKR